MDEWEERNADHGERIAEGDKVDAALWIGRRPLGEGELCRILAQDRNVTPPLASEPFASDVQERFTEIDEVNGVELRNGKVLVHELDIVT